MPSSAPPLSVSQAASESGHPARTIRHAIKIGALKAHKLPGYTGAYVIKRHDFDRWVAKRAAAKAAS